MSTTLPLDLFNPDWKWAAWADYGWLINPGTDRQRIGETCRSCISIDGTFVLRTLGDNRRSFPEGGGSTTGTAATGAVNICIKRL